MVVLIALTSVAVAAGLTALLVPVVRALAFRLSLIDTPGGRKNHTRPVPLGGGPAMLIAIGLPTLAAVALANLWSATGGPSWVPPVIALHLAGVVMRTKMALIILGGAAAMCALGLWDDRRPMGPWIKLVGQFIVVGAVVILADLRILTILGEPLSTIVSIVWVIVIVNAMNFMDNMDGLCAGVALICALALVAAAAGIGQLFVGGWLCLLIGATAGFLVFNFPPARIFMGDAGSMMLGFMLAVLSMLTTYYDPSRPLAREYALLVPVVLLAVPLYDFASVMFIRIREKRNPMVGDSMHFSHRLVRRGLSVRPAVLTIYLCTAVTAVAAVLLPHVPSWAAWLLAGQTLGVLGIIAVLESTTEKP